MGWDINVRVTRLVMFTDIMNAVRYGKILESSLVPFIKTFFPTTFDLFLVSLSNNTSTNLAEKFWHEQLFFQSFLTSSTLRISPFSISDVLTSSIVAKDGGAAVSLY